jgi:hypothetical protein
LSGFEPNQVVELYVHGPEGPVLEKVRVHLDDFGDGEWETLIDTFWASGEFEVYVVREPSLLGYAKFTIQEPPAPRIVVIPQDGPPGQVFRIIMAGFQPGERVPVHLYRQTGQDQWEYLTSLPFAQMDARGQNPLHRVPTQPGDPEGDYMVATVPESVGYNTFHIGN